MPNIPTLMPVLGLLATAVAAFVIILKGLVIPVLLALLVYAWSCLLADRIVQAHKPSALSLGYYPKRWPAVISGTVVSVLVITACASSWCASRIRWRCCVRRCLRRLPR